MDNKFSKAINIIESITRELKDPIVMSYLVTGDDYSYENFPMKHLIDEKLFNRIVRYFIDQDGFLFDLFLEHHDSYSDFKLFESKFMSTNYSKRDFLKRKLGCLSNINEDEDPILPDICTIDEFIFEMSRGNSNFLKFKAMIDNNLPFRLPGRKFAMYLNLLNEYNRQKPSVHSSRDVPNERILIRPTHNFYHDEKKVYYVKYYQNIFPNDYEKYDEFQRQMNIPYVTEEEYFEILKH